MRSSSSSLISWKFRKWTISVSYARTGGSWRTRMTIAFQNSKKLSKTTKFVKIFVTKWHSKFFPSPLSTTSQVHLMYWNRHMSKFSKWRVCLTSFTKFPGRSWNSTFTTSKWLVARCTGQPAIEHFETKTEQKTRKLKGASKPGPDERSSNERLNHKHP